MRIIASDYDGTLNYGGVDDAKRNAVERWQKQGNLFVVVTGRDKQFCPEMQEKSGIMFDYYLACNGALILNSRFEVLAQKRCEGDVLQKLIAELFSLGCEWATVCADETVRIWSDTAVAKPRDGKTVADIGRFSYFNQVSTALPTFEESARVAAVIASRFSGIVNPLQNGTCLDIVPAGMDKAKGIEDLLTLCGAMHEDVVTVGDNVNDLAMLKAYRSYAMANGVSEVIQIADATVESVTELIELEMAATGAF